MTENKRAVRGWTFYDWANSAYSLTITSAIFPAYYEAETSTKDASGNVINDTVEFLGFEFVNTALYSYTIAAGFLTVLLVAPLLSGIADYGGKKKKFLQFFCYLGALACAALYFFDYDPVAEKGLTVGILGMFLACIGWSGGNIFYNAYLPQIAPPERHDSISAWGYALGYIGSVILLVWNLHMIMVPEVYSGILGPDADAWAQKAAQVSCLSVGIWWLLFAQYTFVRLPKDESIGKVDGSILKYGYKEVSKVFKEIKSNLVLKRYLLAFFVYNMGVQTTMYMAANFAAKEIKSRDEFGNDVPFETANLIITILIIQLVAIVGAFLFSWLSRRLGNMRALTISVVAWVFIVTWAYKVEYATAFYALAAFVGLVMGGIQALSRSTYSKLLPQTKDLASYFSFYNMCHYGGTVLGTLGFGLVLDVTGDIRNSILVIGSGFVIGLLILLTVPKSDEALS